MPSHHLQLVWTRAALSTEDVMVAGFDFSQIPASWPAAAPENYETCETAILTWWGALRASYGDEVILSQARWYREDDDTLPWGPPARVTTFSGQAGQSTGASCPPQVSVTVTERNAQGKKHWGRFYMPNPAVTVVDQPGRLTAGFRGTLAAATGTLYNAWADSGLEPIVRCVVGGLPVFSRVEEIAVDDVFDVQRSRRYSVVLARSTALIDDNTP